MNPSRHPQKGSLILVVLCFVAVLGIGLAGYLAVSSQSVKLSNRSYVKGVSSKLAEMGLEEALRALNANNFSSWTFGVSPNQTVTNWMVSGTTASGTVILPVATYGNPGIAGSAKIRVDHYNAAPWDGATSYSTGDMVWARGVWFQCKAANVNQVPPNANWISAPAAWSRPQTTTSTISPFSGAMPFAAFSPTATRSRRMRPTGPRASPSRRGTPRRPTPPTTSPSSAAPPTAASWATPTSLRPTPPIGSVLR